MNNFKRVLIIALCSILCVCTVPRFSLRSEAAEASVFALRQSILYLSSYLSSRGYSIAHEYGSSIPSISELKDMTLDQMGLRYYGIADKLNAFGATHNLPGAGDELLMRIEIALRTGALVLSPSLRDTIDWWLADSTSDGSVVVGNTTKTIKDFSYSSNFNYHYTQSQGSFTFDYYATFNIDTIPLFYTPYSSFRELFFVPTDISDFTYNALTNEYSFEQTSGSYLDSTVYTVDGKNYRVYFKTNIVSNVNFTPFLYTTPNNNLVADYISGLLDNITVSGVDIVSTRLTDTSGTELLTSTNTIASDGTVEGDTTIYLPDEDTLETALDQYNSQSITLDEFLKILGINNVADDATVAEKEDALSVVVTPSEDYLWFTKTQWGSEAIEETRKASAATRAEEDSLADSIASTANGGSAPEDNDNKSRGKGLLALLLIGLGIWNTPIIAGDGTPSGGGTDDKSDDGGSGDTSGYLAESIAGMAVAGSLVDDLFDSAGGSDGYGLIYTVGASFVIFSVIIGAANYFGALFHGSDTKQNIKASGKRSTPGKNKKGG